MFLSIIIPHYNLSRELLERCLDSIMTQGLSNEEFEVIVVDDGSAERPYWVKEKYKDLQLVNAEHGGLGHARNVGMEKAAGKYILFVDSDDYLQPNSLKKCLDKLKAEKAQILRFKFRRTDGKRSNKIAKTPYTISGAAYMAMNNLSGCAWSYIFSRELADKYNIRFQCGVYHEDEEFSTKLHFYSTSLIDCMYIVYNYYIRSGSITQSTSIEDREKRIKDFLGILESVNTFKKNVYQAANPIQKRGIDRKLTMLTVDAIINLIHAGKSNEEIWEICDDNFRKAGLYPLPKRNYSLKYKIFRIMANCKIGIKILRTFIHKN